MANRSQSSAEARRPPAIATTHYATEAEGQEEFFAQFGIDRNDALILNTDGVHNGNLLEFKLHIPDLNQVLFQAIKYLSRLRINGRNVPANILLVDLNAATIYKYDAADYYEEIHQIYTTSASRDNDGFKTREHPVEIKDCFVSGAQTVKSWLAETDVVPVTITVDCVVAWAERFYREVPGANKAAFLNNDRKKGPLGELKHPRHFRGVIVPYEGDHYEEFSHILDRLNDKLKKIELGAFYTPDPYVVKAQELLREAIGRVPEGNDYVILDRCAGTGILEQFLTDDELSHVIVNTYEEFEYLELLRELNGRVRDVIPPTYMAGDPQLGVLLNGDALSKEFILGVPDPNGDRVPNPIQECVDNPHCTIILFENPPYAEVAGIEAQKKGGRESFGWKSSYVKEQMTEAVAKTRGTKPVNELSNLFIWSAFKYYLRQPTDSYIVFSPVKYFKQHKLISKKFVRGFLFNRKHFHATADAGVSVVLWANEDEVGRTEFPLEMWDIGKSGELVPGAVHKDAPDPPEIAVKTTSKLLSTLYDNRKFPDDEPGIVCEKNGNEAHREIRGNPIWNKNIVGYLITKSFSFENADLMTQLTRCAAYDANGFYLRRDNFLPKLPLFAVGRYPSVGRFWVRGVVSRCADNGDNFSDDQDFLKSCLIYTALAYHNKCRSFTGSDGREYRNELCFGSDETAAAEELQKFTLSKEEEELLTQWERVLEIAKKTDAYNPALTYGLYQIDCELNERRRVIVGGKAVTEYKYPLLNGEIKTLKLMTTAYHANVIAPKLWRYDLLK
jgi:hypothetical protein